MNKQKDLFGKYSKRGPMLRMEIKGRIYAPSGKVNNQFFNHSAICKCSQPMLRSETGQ